MSIIIKENIDNIKDLPNISVQKHNDERHIDNIAKSITNIISKKKLIIQLLNKNLTKKIINETDNIPFTKLETEYNDGITQNKIIKHDNFRFYPKNINFLHLVIYHNINIDKLLLFLLYRFYIRDSQNNYRNYDNCRCISLEYNNSISNIVLHLYGDVINSANKFDKLNINFDQDYETLFLSDYENLKEDDMDILIENDLNNMNNTDIITFSIKKNKELDKRIDIIIEQNNIQYNDTKNDMNILIEKNKELEKKIDIIIEQNNNEIDKLNKSINKLSNQIEVYKTIVNNLLEDRK